MAPFAAEIETLRGLQRDVPEAHRRARLLSAKDGVSPGICHQVAREQFIEPGDFIQATDSHTCMGGGNNALAYGVGATEYAALVHSGFTFVRGARVDPLRAARAASPPGVTAKDLMLHILAHLRAARRRRSTA